MEKKCEHFLQPPIITDAKQFHLESFIQKCIL